MRVDKDGNITCTSYEIEGIKALADIDCNGASCTKCKANLKTHDSKACISILAEELLRVLNAH